MSGVLIRHSSTEEWLQQHWRNQAMRDALRQDYAALGDLQHFLADLALRSGALVAPGIYTSEAAALQAEGARQLGVQVITLAASEPLALWPIIQQARTIEKADDK